MHAYIDKLTHPKRVAVWRGFWSRGIIAQFFFENEQEVSVTVNGNCYRAILSDFSITKIEEEDIANIWFQQDGATCHIAEATVEVLRAVWRVHFQLQSWCRLATSKLRFDTVGLIFVGCRRDKPKTIDALNDIIRKAIGEIQLHTQSIICLKIGPIVQATA